MKRELHQALQVRTLIVGTRKFDAVSDIPCDLGLHWLPVFQALRPGLPPRHGHTIPVRVDTLHARVQRTHSSCHRLAHVTETNIGVPTPAAWDDPPAELTDFKLSLSAFRKLLKTVLFNLAHWLWFTIISTI